MLHEMYLHKIVSLYYLMLKVFCSLNLLSPELD